MSLLGTARSQRTCEAGTFWFNQHNAGLASSFSNPSFWFLSRSEPLRFGLSFTFPLQTAITRSTLRVSRKYGYGIKLSCGGIAVVVVIAWLSFSVALGLHWFKRWLVVRDYSKRPKQFLIPGRSGAVVIIGWIAMATALTLLTYRYSIGFAAVIGIQWMCLFLPGIVQLSLWILTRLIFHITLARAICLLI